MQAIFCVSGIKDSIQLLQTFCQFTKQSIIDAIVINVLRAIICVI